MFGLGGNDGPSELQEQILRAYERNPDAGPEAIASICDCSESYVRETINEYKGGFGGAGDLGLF